MARNIIRIDLTPDAKRSFHRVVYGRGTTQVVAVDRLVGWLSDQHPGVQAAVLGQYPKAIEADVARPLLGRIDRRAGRGA